MASRHGNRYFPSAFKEGSNNKAASFLAEMAPPVKVSAKPGSGIRYWLYFFSLHVRTKLRDRYGSCPQRRSSMGAKIKNCMVLVWFGQQLTQLVLKINTAVIDSCGACCSTITLKLGDCPEMALAFNIV